MLEPPSYTKAHPGSSPLFTYNWANAEVAGTTLKNTTPNIAVVKARMPKRGVGSDAREVCPALLALPCAESSSETATHEPSASL